MLQSVSLSPVFQHVTTSTIWPPRTLDISKIISQIAAGLFECCSLKAFNFFLVKLVAKCTRSSVSKRVSSPTVNTHHARPSRLDQWIKIKWEALLNQSEGGNRRMIRSAMQWGKRNVLWGGCQFCSTWTLPYIVGLLKLHIMVLLLISVSRLKTTSVLNHLGVSFDLEDIQSVRTSSLFLRGFALTLVEDTVDLGEQAIVWFKLVMLLWRGSTVCSENPILSIDRFFTPA